MDSNGIPAQDNAITCVLAAGELGEACRTMGIEPARVAQVIDRLAPLYHEIDAIARDTEGVVVISVEQKEDMERARRARLCIRELRVRAEKVRKQEKDEYLKMSRVIDRLAQIPTALAEKAEARLLEQEEFAARVEAARLDALESERAKALAPYYRDVHVFDLRGMSEDQFAEALRCAQAAKREREEEAERARKAAAEREAAQRAENERLASENRRLAAERKKAEEEAAKARKEKEALEAGERERAAREAKEAKDKLKRERAAAQAPDAEKIAAWARALRGIPVPDMATEAGRDRMAELAGAASLLADTADLTASELRGEL